MTDYQIVTLHSPPLLLAEYLVDAHRERRWEDARFYSNAILLSVPSLPHSVVNAVYRLGRK